MFPSTRKFCPNRLSGRSPFSSSNNRGESNEEDYQTHHAGGVGRPKGTPPDVIASMAKSVREILSEPAVAAQLRETQQMTLVLADAKDFGTFFAKQVGIWGQVVRENNIKA
jgi:tripartite-type tricarboxylate transporter receptor subunit TctC